jgi:hypothetical protein
MAGATSALAVALAQGDQADREWRRENTPMDRSRRMMLRPAPIRRLGLPSERIYFAHPMPDYDTRLEARAIEAIHAEFGPEFEVVNPNHPDHEAGYEAAGRDFSYWTDLARSCGAVVYMALPNDWIGSGVWKEAEAAIRANRRVHELPRDLSHSTRVAHLDVARCLSVEETRRTTRMILAYRRDYADG